MAKKTAKKAADPAAPNSAAKTTAAPPQPKAKKAPPAKKAETTKAEAAPSVDDGAIGHAAGDVWGFLHGKDAQTLAAVKKAAETPELALLAIGWLAREGKLEFTASGRSVKVSLK